MSQYQSIPTAKLHAFLLLVVLALLSLQCQDKSEWLTYFPTRKIHLYIKHYSPPCMSHTILKVQVLGE